MTWIGFQLIALMACLLALLLLAYWVYVKIAQQTWTEKRFNFVALWSCGVMIVYTIATVVEFPLISEILLRLNIQTSAPTTMDKFLVVALAGVYTLTVAWWAKNWNGTVTEDGFQRADHRTLLYFVNDGIGETIRIMRRQASSPVYAGFLRDKHEYRLPKPIESLTFEEQIRDLVLGHWKEFIIEDKAWISECQCWRLVDMSLDQTVLVLCATNIREINFERLGDQIRHAGGRENVRVFAVFEEIEDKEEILSFLSDLVSKTEVFSYEELIVRCVPLERYKRDIRKQFLEEKLPNAPFSIEEIFVPPRINGTRISASGKLVADGTAIALGEFVTGWIEESRLRHIALLGEYGQGKSTAALELTYRLLHDDEFALRCGNRVPLLVRLTGTSPKNLRPEEFLSAWGTRFGLDGRTLLALHRAGKTILIFDAFDEMANIADRADRLDHFGSLWQFACAGSKILFTGRPNFFLDDEELKDVLGIREDSSIGAYCTALRVEPFSREQIEGSLRWLPKEKIAEFMNAVAGLPQLEEIVRRPSLLFQISQLWENGRINLEKADIESATVIRKFVSYSLERQVAKQRDQVESDNSARQFIFLRKSELEYFTIGCAVAALSDGRNNSLPIESFRKTIEKLLEKSPDSFLKMSKDDVGALSMPLSERLRDKEDRVEACVHAVRTHGVLELDPSKNGFYKFSHKSFPEVLSAEVIVSKGFGLEGYVAKIYETMQPVTLISQKAVFSFAIEIAKTLDIMGKEYSTADVLSKYTGMIKILTAWNVFVWRLTLRLPGRTKMVENLTLSESRRKVVANQAAALFSILTMVTLMLMSGIFSGRSYGLYRSGGDSTFFERVLTMSTERLMSAEGLIVLGIGVAIFFCVRHLTMKRDRLNPLLLVVFCRALARWASDEGDRKSLFGWRIRARRDPLDFVIAKYLE